MTFARRWTAARGLAAAASALLVTGVLAAATPASSSDREDVPRTGGASATLDGLRTYGQAVVHENGESRSTGAGLFQMAVDGGGTFQTYSVDVDNPIQEGARYEESSADTTSLHANRHAGQIRWILRHSYPQVDDLPQLARRAGVEQLTPGAAAAGTQVAIWRYSDGQHSPDRSHGPHESGHSGGQGKRQGASSHGKKPRVEAADPAAEKLAGYLVRAARQTAEPTPSLSLSRTSVSGKGGGLLGPITVRTREPSVTVAPSPDAAAKGVKVVGKNGKPMTSAHNGSKLYFSVPAGARPGSTSLAVQAATKVPVGRTLAGAAGDVRSPAQVIAGSSWSTVSARADVQWADHGAIPTASVRKDCARGVVDTTVRNDGDRKFRFRLAGRKHLVAAGKTRTVPVPVREDQPYRIAVSGPHGYQRVFSGVLDCAAVSSHSGHAGGQQGSAQGAEPQLTRPATVGGAGQAAGEDSADLAQTGSSSNTPTVIGIAVGLVAVGTVAVLMVRRREPDPEDQPDGAGE